MDYNKIKERLNERRNRSIDDMERLSNAIEEKAERIEDVELELEFLETEMRNR